MILPNLFIPGAGKSATSSFHELLNQHSQIFMSETKEPHFFSNDNNFDETQKAKSNRLKDYANLFEKGRNSLYRGESSTGYMVFPHVVERIKNTVTDPKFIFILRNPIDRAYSHYWWLRGRGFEPRPFREAVLADINESPDPENRAKGFGGYRYYFAFGQYGTYLRPFVNAFGSENVLVITTEQLRLDGRDALNHCFRFLGLKALDNLDFVRANETVVYKQAWLYRFFLSFGSQTALSKIFRQRLPDTAFWQLLIFRNSLATKLAGKLHSKNSYPPISQNDRDWLRNLYSEEISMLRRITRLHFEEWQNDFPINAFQSAVLPR